jgi:hypothetical protein
MNSPRRLSSWNIVELWNVVHEKGGMMYGKNPI